MLNFCSLYSSVPFKRKRTESLKCCCFSVVSHFCGYSYCVTSASNFRMSATCLLRFQNEWVSWVKIKFLYNQQVCDFVYVVLCVVDLIKIHNGSLYLSNCETFKCSLSEVFKQNSTLLKDAPSWSKTQITTSCFAHLSTCVYNCTLPLGEEPTPHTRSYPREDGVSARTDTQPKVMFK